MRSQNGWNAAERLPLDNSPVPGTSVKLAPGVLAGDVATVLHYVAMRFHREVEPLGVGCWGFNYRAVRGATTLSNHASGTAMDLNAPRHPLGKVGTFSRSQVENIGRILDDCGGVIRWGGNYAGRKDEMHFEVVGSGSAVAALAARVSGGTAEAPGSTPIVHETHTAPTEGSRIMFVTVQAGSADATHVRVLQGLLKAAAAVGICDDPGDIDGDFGPHTTACVRQYQSRMSLVPDGIVGPQTFAALNAVTID